MSFAQVILSLSLGAWSQMGLVLPCRAGLWVTLLGSLCSLKVTKRKLEACQTETI